MFSQSKKIALAIGFSGNYMGLNYLKNLGKQINLLLSNKYFLFEFSLLFIIGKNH